MCRCRKNSGRAKKENNLIVDCHETDTQSITITHMAFTCIPCSWFSAPSLATSYVAKAPRVETPSPIVQ